MSIKDSLSSFFKLEVINSGSKLFAQQKVQLSNSSDTAVQVFVKVSPPVKVRLISQGIASASFISECSCPVGAKNRFCKHIWAALLCVEKEHPEFLSEKQNMDHPVTKRPEVAQKTNAKLRAAEYRKAAYQKQKERMKAHKNKGSVQTSAFPKEVEEALAYFSRNGFEMPAGPNRDVLGNAKRTLSRVFHPDKGGSNAEVIELNTNCEVLLSYFKVL